jgi:hypothetical protein
MYAVLISPLLECAWPVLMHGPRTVVPREEENGPDSAELEIRSIHIRYSIWIRSESRFFRFRGRLSIQCNNAPLGYVVCMINMISGHSPLLLMYEPSLFTCTT